MTKIGFKQLSIYYKSELEMFGKRKIPFTVLNNGLELSWHVFVDKDATDEEIGNKVGNMVHLLVNLESLQLFGKGQSDEFPSEELKEFL